MRTSSQSRELMGRSSGDECVVLSSKMARAALLWVVAIGRAPISDSRGVGAGTKRNFDATL